MGETAAYIGAQEYLSEERASRDKHEYFRGKVSALAGASLAHNRIAGNLIMEIGMRVKGKGCEVLASDMRVCTPAHDAYMYPDIVIVCGKPEMADQQFDTLINPMVIIEILSPSTADHDRGKKFFYYRQIPFFREYLLIDSLEPIIETCERRADGSWIFDVTNDVRKSIYLSSIDAWLPMEEIYSNVF